MVQVTSSNELDERWQDRVQDRTLGHTANDLTPTVRLVFGELLSRQTIDLRGLVNVNPLQLCVVLRATFDELDMTLGWQEAFELAKKTLVQDGIDPANAMYGLIRSPE